MREPTDEMLDELNVPYLADAERVIAMERGGYWPTLLKLQDGTLGAALRGGAPHVGLNSRLDWLASQDGGKTWSVRSNVVPGNPKLDIRGAGVGQMADGTLVVGYIESTMYLNGKFDPSVGTWTPFYVMSRDGGYTWTGKIPLHDSPFNNRMALYGRIITLPDGTALMPHFGCTNADPKIMCNGIMRSRDNGKSWGDCSIIASGFNETTLLRPGDGRLLAFMRKRSADEATWQSVSTDDGYSWSDPEKLTIAHQHPPDACLLQSGNILFTYGNRIMDLAVGGMLSNDEGRSWNRDERVILARNSLVLQGKTWGDCGYPSTVQLDDGTIVTIYYRLGSDMLSKQEQEQCLQYERDAFLNPPASQDMRQFEQCICIRYTEKQLQDACYAKEQ